MTVRRTRWATGGLAAVFVLLAGCTSGPGPARPAPVGSASAGSGAPTASTGAHPQSPTSTPASSPATTSSPAATPKSRIRLLSPKRALSGPSRSTDLPGMPANADQRDIYAAAGANALTSRQRRFPKYAYVPHNRSGDVWVIDQRTHAVVRKCRVGIEVQHVVPSYDMTQLYATDDVGNKVRVIDPSTGRCGRTIAVVDPYNMYFTPDGRYAISVAEERQQLIWYNPISWKVHDITSVPGCAGVDHADFSADGRTAVFTCEFAGAVVVVDVLSHKVLRKVTMPVVNRMMGPQDIKLAPDGSAYYIADSDSNGVWMLNGAATKVLRHIPTGKGAHGLYLSRNAKLLYVTNRLEGSVSVLDAYTGRVRTRWVLPGGGSPDMGNVSADGKRLWVSGRYDDVVYVIDTRNGHLLSKIPVGNGPHGLALMPLPGRYSLGHTGITR